MTIEELEKTFAYEFATGTIDCNCFDVDLDSETWIDIDTCDKKVDLRDELRYLESRRLVKHHPTRPNLIQFCDEDEPTTAEKEESNG